jgi:ureidoglycolate hydrolase
MIGRFMCESPFVFVISPGKRKRPGLSQGYASSCLNTDAVPKYRPTGLLHHPVCEAPQSWEPQVLAYAPGPGQDADARLAREPPAAKSSIPTRVDSSERVDEGATRPARLRRSEVGDQCIPPAPC